MNKTKEPLVFSVINEEYLQLGESWALEVEKVSGKMPEFVCADDESFRYLNSRGYLCRKTVSDLSLASNERVIFDNSTFPSDKAAFTVSLKLAEALSKIRSETSILFSDVDAIWRRNPIDYITDLDVDFAFQPGSFPENVKSEWGFSICTGFFFMRPCAANEWLLAEAVARFDGSDQRTVNQIFLSDFEVDWSERPSRWEHCGLEGGWVTPIMGRCKKTGLSLAALPHSYYQRHGTKVDTCEHAVIVHPNSEKDQQNKFSVLNQLGIDLFRPS